jgi:hypothetical protein
MARKTKRRPSTPPKKRNLAARAARNQKAGAMKDRREPKRGARNETRELLENPE